MSWGSNYPPSNYPPVGGNPYAQNAASAAAGFPPSSGPPPPPGAGGYGYGGYGYAGPSAYNVNQYPGYGPPGGGYGYSTGGGYYGQQPPPPGYGQQPSGAVPGFTVPAGPQYGQGPPGMPPASQYAMMQNHMANQSLYHMQQGLMQKMGLIEKDEEWEEEQKKKMRQSRRNMDDDEAVNVEEEKRKAEERARKAEERVIELQERLETDDGLKTELRQRFIDELMRRQETNGTFEATMGTMFPFDGKYDGEDPVAKWFATEKGDPIEGESWDALYDAEYMRNGIRGWGTDEAAIIAVVSTRSNAQRNRMLLEYKTAYGRDLIDDLKGDLSGKFRECVLALFETPARYDAWSIKKAIYGAGTNERTLIEILMTRTNAQIKEMVEEYNNITYRKRKKGQSTIERDIQDDTSGDFKHLLIAIVQGNRRLIPREKLEDAVVETTHEGRWTGMFTVDYTKLLNMDRVAKRAQELFEAGQEHWGTNEEVFVRIFSTQDYYTMRAIWDEYVKISQNDVMSAVDSETSGDFRRGLLAIAQNIRCRPMYFAERLYKSMKGLGTDDSTLIRVCVSRSEMDMAQIKACFLEKYHKTLWKFIMEDTSGDYRKLLCGIVGKN